MANLTVILDVFKANAPKDEHWLKALLPFIRLEPLNECLDHISEEDRIEGFAEMSIMDINAMKEIHKSNDIYFGQMEFHESFCQQCTHDFKRGAQIHQSICKIHPRVVCTSDKDVPCPKCSISDNKEEQGDNKEEQSDNKEEQSDNKEEQSDNKEKQVEFKVETVSASLLKQCKLVAKFESIY
ncbi:hypothetical protein BU24DRAFT_415966 [Aaosphaeria arxii CBS 175.79]|uniref:Uncharacterized protein n=1 Tax=Aaosphaeria arxii CBS 175.79 TaxID=1450172 RepID=A0A6A5X5W0_9PLEO|nr:uncharacterized protein BU24DRAFT_415966 [Aaosphaeria arxii CBS 175.79]KAF2008329.1 hypothetical protein BU24DRAFT_415966 [Aaosphaeria arxii CBS 175.79]